MENKTIWIWNHYATSMFSEKGGRHHWFGKYLIRKGYNVKIFCASTLHSSLDTVDTNGKDFITAESDGIEYVFISTPQYVGNGKARIKNMYSFYKKLFPTANAIAKESGKPAVILASSVHPLTLIAGIKVAKKFKIPCVCEVRDLWPESLIEIGMIGRESAIAKALYAGEKWIYKKADKLIFTMPGGKDYIEERNLNRVINSKNVFNVNNGVDLEGYRFNQENEILEDEYLNDSSKFKVIYTGSIRRINLVDDLVKVAEICQNKGKENIDFIVYGDGDQRERLEQDANDKELKNLHFRGRIEKKYIPYVLSKSDLNVVTGEKSNLGRYGISWNKLFEYMASGKPIVANYTIARYNFINDYNIGVAKRFDTIEDFADEIIKMSELSGEEYAAYKERALGAAADFDYRHLTDKLEEILIEAVNDYSKR